MIYINKYVVICNSYKKFKVEEVIYDFGELIYIYINFNKLNKLKKILINKYLKHKFKEYNVYYITNLESNKLIILPDNFNEIGYINSIENNYLKYLDNIDIYNSMLVIFDKIDFKKLINLIYITKKIDIYVTSKYNNISTKLEEINKEYGCSIEIIQNIKKYDIYLLFTKVDIKFKGKKIKLYNSDEDIYSKEYILCKKYKIKNTEKIASTKVGKLINERMKENNG